MKSLWEGPKKVYREVLVRRAKDSRRTKDNIHRSYGEKDQMYYIKVPEIIYKELIQIIHGSAGKKDQRKYTKMSQ